MGLAGRKEKQRIPHDPRNLSWADDANKFGAAYLQKLGWSAGTGLGTSGEGRTTHIKVQQKLDMFGIGAAHQKDPNGLAWKQNRDFENLLRRLNAANGEGGAEEAASSSKIDGFAKAAGEPAAEAESSKKRKRDGGQDGDEVEEVKETKEERKKRKKEEKEKRKKEKKEKKEKKAKAAEVEEKAAASSPEPQAPVQAAPRLAVGRPVRAHRARFMASKNIASKSSAAIDEILGISRSGTSTPYPTTSIPDTPAEPSSSATPSDEDGLKLQELTTSSKSVMDYFKEKLLAKSNSATGSSTPVASTSTSCDAAEEPDDYDERPRGGLGLGFGAGSSKTGLGASRLRSEVTFEQDVEETTRTGLGAFSRMSAMFSSAKLTESSSESKTETIEMQVEEESAVVDDSRAEDGERKKKKKDKGKKREEVLAVEEKDGKKEKKKRKRDAEESEEPIAEKPADEQKATRKDKAHKSRAEEQAVEGSKSSKKKSRKTKKIKSSEYVVDDDS